MPSSFAFGCYLVGSNSRLVECARLVLSKGHRIHGILSSDPTVSQWADENQIRCDDLAETSVLTHKPFDYLFSIDNPLILPDSVLRLPREMAVNFHDAPLPHYAGVNAVSWAILNRESTHGVTWHVMTARVDAGDILKQSIVPLSEAETALTLNAKCFDASLTSFAELLDEIDGGRVERRPQPTSGRTFFPRFQRPPLGGVLDFGTPAEDLDALVRALDFGPYPNPLGVPKLFLGNRALAIGSLRMGGGSQANPGTVQRLSDETIQVATPTRDVVIGALTTLRGEDVQLRDMVPVTTGERMPRLDPASTAQLEALHRDAAAQEGFWERRLKKLQPIAFPVRRTRRETVVSAGIGKQVLRMPSPRLGEGVQVTGNTMLAAFVLYLHRITSQSEFDLSFRAETAARGLGTTGWFFTSRVPIRVSLDSDLSFLSFTADVCGQLRAQQDRGPLCADLSTRVPELRNGVPPFRALKIGIKRVPCIEGSELSMEGVEFDALIPDDGQSMEWRYDERAVCRDDVERMAAEFATLVEAIHKRPTEPVWQHPIVPSEERDAMGKWNDTAAPYPDDRCIHQLFEEQVVRTPNAIAVVFEGEELTYRQLNRRANRLAHHLIGMGIGPEVMVGLYLERSIEMMIGMLAVLKAGGAYVPLDPAYPADRLAYILKDTQAPVLLTLTSLLPHVPDCSAETVCIDWEFPAGVAGDFGDPEVGVEPDNLIYVIHTSGSTGRPKGVLVNHRSVCNFVYWKQQTFPLRCEDRVLQRLTFSFDASVWAFFGPLIAGARIVLAPPDRHNDISQLVKLIETSGVTTMKMVPSLLRLLTDHGGLERCKALRRIYSGGEPLKNDLRDRLLELTNAEVLNIYGPTEATIDVTYWCCERGIDDPVVPIGRPVSNVQLHILDERGQRVPIGVEGELHIGGICLARGYLDLPKLTRENFIPDPFQEGSDMRLYRTGDLARWRTDGSVEFLGRRDNQVKLHGFRIELQEIESVLEAHSQVRTAAVSVREDIPGTSRLVAYIVPTPGQDPRAWELRDYLRASLPAYMVPSSYVTQEALPTGPNGKVDRNALPAPNRDRPDLRAYAEPDTPEEAALERVWADVLGLERVGVLDDFFDLGGNSVLSLEIVSGTRRELGIQLPIAKLFQYPQIRSLAKYLSSGDRGKTLRTETSARARRQREALRRRRFQEAERQ